MRFLALAAVFSATCSPVLADASCVQKQLARLGFDPGPVDGLLGPSTIAAAERFHRGMPVLPDLSLETSQEWCNHLAALPGPPNFDAARDLPIADPSASAGTLGPDALGATPVLGVSPEYKVPSWVD